MLIDLTGKRFGRLTVVRRAVANGRQGQVRWECLCDCGASTVAHSRPLRTGHTRSCGCLRKDVSGFPIEHGGTGTDEHKIYLGMLTRCTNPNRPGYKDYGGRGITVCERWTNSFANFLADMGPRPSRAHSIERINNDVGYEPGNCRWATRHEQINNRRNTRFVVYQGSRMALTDATRRAGGLVHHETVWGRIKAGWPVQEALETPKLHESPRRGAVPAELAFSRARAGRRHDLGAAYFRSSWEANYARYLNLLMQLGVVEFWHYEPETFWFNGVRRGTTSYKPDFRIKYKGDDRLEYVEIKGWETPKDRTKWRRMAKYHPTVKLVIVGEKEYEALRRKWASSIPEWESSKGGGRKLGPRRKAA